MWKKRTLAILTATAIACSAVQPLAAQGYNDREYGGYNDRYSGQYGNDSGRYDNGQYDNGQSNTYYDNDRDRYERDRYNYERERDRYEADRTAAARFDRMTFYRDCERQRQNSTAGGAIVGALAGGLLGNAISRGPQRGAGTAVGAIFGGVLGATIGNKMTCEDRSYAVDASYRGFEAGRPHERYDWRSPRGPYGYLEVGDYYRDRGGYRCANYTQEIWIDGHPETGRGHACRQPDGTWRFVD